MKKKSLKKHLRKKQAKKALLRAEAEHDVKEPVIKVRKEAILAGSIGGPRKSIIDNDECCYICKTIFGKCWPCGTEQIHHVWRGSANRRLADQDGLWVRLCPEHHRILHDQGTYDNHLMEVGERMWILKYGKTKEEFTKRYGKNIL